MKQFTTKFFNSVILSTSVEQPTISKFKIKNTNFKLKIYSKLKRIGRVFNRRLLARVLQRTVIFFYHKYLLNSMHLIQNNQLKALNRKSTKVPYSIIYFSSLRNVGFAPKRRPTFYVTNTTQSNFTQALYLQYFQ